jgi:hypothetical protein
VSDPRDDGGYENRPYSDRELVPVMEKLYRRIEGEIDTLKGLGQTKSHALDDLNKAKARAWLLCKTEHPEMSSDKLREAWVINQTEVGDLMLAADLAETIYKDQQTTIRALQSSVDLLRTMAASVRNATE